MFSVYSALATGKIDDFSRAYSKTTNQISPRPPLMNFHIWGKGCVGAKMSNSQLVSTVRPGHFVPSSTETGSCNPFSEA